MRVERPIENKRSNSRGTARLLMLISLTAILFLPSGCDAVSNKVKCRACGGTGDCQPCGGDGKHVIWAAGCSHCKDDGVCVSCNGYGYTLD